MLINSKVIDELFPSGKFAVCIRILFHSLALTRLPLFSCNLHITIIKFTLLFAT